MDPITREEQLMAGEQLEPITRKEYFLAKAAGMDVETPEPITREEMFLSMISGGGTGGSGGADWNAKEGEPGYVENRPFWKETEKVQTMSDLEMPLVVTTADVSGAIGAQGQFGVANDTKNYVVFDGVEYECEPYYVSEFGGWAIGSMDLADYPFFIMNGVILTKTAGEHTVAQYYDSSKVIANYSPCLVVETEETSDNKPYLNMEDVERIKNAYNNGIPVWLDTSWGNVVQKMQVTDVTASFIYAFGCFDYGSKCTSVVVYSFSIKDGSLYDENFSVTGSIKDNGSLFPVMVIKNIIYKITVGDSGNLVATEIT